MPLKRADPDAPGIIVKDAVYTRSEMLARLNFGDVSLGKARRAGLRSIRIGIRQYYRGVDILAYFDKLADSTTE